ncbi:MAG: putative 2OG-Fe(II) oxygenase [Sphingomicrobium sp.]
MAALGDGSEAAALPVVTAAARAHPGEAALWQVLGLLHRELEDMGPAMAAFETAARLSPTGARIAHGHARVTLEAGLPSLGLFERAVRLAPNDGDVLISRSAALLAENQADTAIQEFDAMLSRNPEWVAGHAALAQLRWMAGDTRGFLASLDRALAAHPLSAPLWFEKIRLLIEADLYGDGLIAVRAAREALGPDRALAISEAICASELGDEQLADRLFESLVPFDDVNVAVRHIRHLLRTGRADQAARLAESLVDGEDADHVWPYLSVAWRLLDDPRWAWLEGDPALVGISDLSEAIGSLEGLAAKLRSLHVARHQPIDQSVRGGTQTDGPLLARVDPEIRHLRKVLVAAVERHLSTLKHDPAHPFLRHRPASIRFAGSWSVRLDDGGRHSNHVHPQGLVSSALYVAVPPSVASGDSGAGFLVLGQPPAELELDLAPLRTVRPKPGQLVLFPSIMWHGTNPFESGERLTVAFDVAKPR